MASSSTTHRRREVGRLDTLGSRRSGRSYPALLTAALVLLGIALPVERATAADSDSDALVVFTLEGSDETADLREQLTSVVREEARRGTRYELVNDNPVVLSDAVVVLGCKSVSTTCLGKAAEHFGADFLVYGKVEEVKGRSRVSVRLYDPAKGRYVRSFGRVITKMSEPYTAFRRKVSSLLGLESRTSDKPSPENALRVRSNVEGASVTIDGEAAGETPLDRKGLEPGRHEIRVDADGYEPWTTEVELDRESTVAIRASLTPEKTAEPSSGTTEKEPASGTASTTPTPGPPDSDVPPAPSERSWAAQWGPWMAIGGGTLALGGAVVAGAEIQRAENDLEAWRNRNNDRTTAVDAPRERELIDRGRRAQTIHRIMLGVGGISVTGGLLWLWFRSIGDDDTSPSSARHLDVAVTGRSVWVGWRW